MMALFFRALFLFMFLSLQSASASQENVAVVVYGKAAGAKPYLRVAQTRMEQLLADNGITVLDQAIS